MLRCNGQRLPQRQQERRLPGGAVLPEPQGEAGDAGAGERDLGGVSAVGEANGDTIDLISEQKLGGVSALTDGLQIQPCLAGAVFRRKVLLLQELRTDIQVLPSQGS